jgi:hypothetical protein
MSKTTKSIPKTDSLVVYLGSDHKKEIWTPECGTIRQWETAKRIIQSETFDFSCMSMIFSKENIGDYSGPFEFLYYTKDGEIHYNRIGKNGKILKSITI